MTEDEDKNRDLALQTKALLPWIEIVRMKLWNFSSFENSSTYTILLNINIYQLTYLSKNFSFLCSFPDLYIELNFFTKNNQTTVPFQRPLAHDHVTPKDTIVWLPHLRGRTPRTGSSFPIRRTWLACNYKFKPFETVRMDYRCFFGGGRCEIKHPNENGTRDARERGQYLETGSDTRLHEAAKVFCDTPTLLHFVSTRSHLLRSPYLDKRSLSYRLDTAFPSRAAIISLLAPLEERNNFLVIGTHRRRSGLTQPEKSSFLPPS